ncbi:MAG: SDR family NAD(P)-dependent oxidoreductase [Myxococcales bacterium]|nr:SDR family NAD(P)-dependent oxidoreductase [Myxococcales bacterium]
MQFAQRFGPWAVVTGASSGIGEAVARQLASKGLDLVLVARRADRLSALSAQLHAQGGQCRVVALDLTGDAACEQLVEHTSDLDVGLLVHAAGFGLGGPHLDRPLHQHLEMLDLNCRSTVELVHAFLPGLQRRGRGGIALVGSILGFHGVPWSAHYAATKAFVVSLAEGLQVEAAPHGVDVSVHAPGPTRTGFFERASMQAGSAADPHSVAGHIVRRLRSRRVVLTDWLGWLIRLSTSTAPRWLRVRIVGQVMRGMTHHR